MKDSHLIQPQDKIMNDLITAQRQRTDEAGERWYQIYCEPRPGAMGSPHYYAGDPNYHAGERWDIPEKYDTREQAQRRVDEMIEDGIGYYWKMTIREW